MDGLCNFWLKLVYGIEVITVFKLTAIMGYFTRNLVYDIYEFARHRALLSEAAKKKRDVFIISTSLLFGGFLLIYIILSGYYVEKLDYDRFIKLNATGVYVQMLIFGAIALAYSLSLVKLRKLTSRFKGTKSSKAPIKKI